MIEEGNAEPDAVSTGSVSTLVNILTAPREAFAALAVRPTVLLPILALMVMNAALVGWYYSEVDTVWLLQTTLEAAGQEVPPEIAEAQGSGTMGRIIGIVSALGAALQILVLLLLAAGYLSLVSLFGNDGVTFKRWLSLAAWSTMPTLAGVLSAIVNVAVNDATHMRPTELNMLSFANLLGIDPAGDGGVSAVLLSLDVTAVWALALMTFGYALWTRRSAAVSLAIIAGPLVIVLAGLGLLAGM